MIPNRFLDMNIVRNMGESWSQLQSCGFCSHILLFFFSLAISLVMRT